MLLLPIGAGCLLANLPLSPMIAEDGALSVLYRMGVEQRDVPAAHLRGHRGDDRLRPAPREPADDAAGRGRPVRHLRHAAARARPRLPAERGGVDRHHRRHRRADLDLRLEPARAAPARADHRLRLQLHGARAAHPAADHALAHHPARAAHPHALHAADHLAADARPLPARRHAGGGDPRADGDPAHRDADAREPHEGVGRRASGSPAPPRRSSPTS